MTSSRIGITLGLAAGLVAALAPGARAQITCGGTISKGETVTLTADVGPCDGVESAIIIESGVLDLGGRTVSCADTNTDGEVSYGLDIRGSRAQVRNGTVTGCLDNVYVGGSGKHAVEGITSTAAARYGFYVASTTKKNRLTGNSATANGDDGFQCRGAKNKIEGNAATGNGEDGIDLTDAVKNKISGNTATGNVDDGIEATGSKNKILGNTATANGEFGIAVGPSKNKAIGNTATGNAAADIFGVCTNKYKNNTFGVGSPSCVK